MKKTLLITGGCGFIGTSLVKYCLENKLYSGIRILDNFSAGTPEDLARVCKFNTQNSEKCKDFEGIELVEGDIRDTETTEKVTKKIIDVVHLAANTGVPQSVEYPVRDMQANVIGTVNMLESARKNDVSKFIFASSGAPAGMVEPPIHEESSLHPVSPYGASKLAGEAYCSAYYHTFDINTVCLRFGNVFGPGSDKKSSVIAKFIRQALEDKECEIYGEGNQTRDFIFIEDLIYAVSKALSLDVGGETFQIAAGSEKTLSEVTELIQNSLQKKLVNMRIKHSGRRKGDVLRNYADTTKARNILGWQAKTGLEEGIDATVEYFLSIRKNKN